MMSLMSLDRGHAASRRGMSVPSRPGPFPIVVALVSLALSDPGLLAPNSTAHAAPNTVNMLPPLKTTVSVVQTATGPVLQAVTKLGGQTFTQVLDLTAAADPSGGACPILNLDLAPITLNLLGLDVATSAICLNITAHQNGGLLGALLCDVANLLNSGTPLGTNLSGLTQTQLNKLVHGLTEIVNRALGAVTTTGPTAGSTPSVTGSAAGSCDILNLSLGPINLTVLGLNVYLSNCSGGPVTVDITAIPADGLLGQLLCDLDNLLNNGGSVQAILGLLKEIEQEISALL
jgi:hypothetical protein